MNEFIVTAEQLEALAAQWAPPEKPKTSATQTASTNSQHPLTVEQIADALDHVDQVDDRQRWFEIGAALKAEFGEAGRLLWDNWSKQSDKYDAADQDKTWNSIDATGGITIGTLLKYAKDGGWQRPKNTRTFNLSDGDDPKNTATIDGFEVYARECFPKKEKQLGAEKEKKTQADILIEIGKTATLFHDGDDSYADVTINDHRETYLIRSKGLRHWLLNSYLNQEGKAPCVEAINSAINCLEAIGRCKGEEHKVFVRVGRAGNKLYLDLCNAKWQAVEIDAAGWRIVDSKDCLVRFRRAKGMGPLPDPEHGGSIEKLRDFLNLESDNKSTDAEYGRVFILIVGWLLSTFRDRGPYPILVEHGEQGSAKTTTARFLRALFDPNVSPLRSEPKELRDLMIAARNGWLVAYDNLSHLDPWLSDALCRLSTGGGFSTRALYTDQDETIFEAQRPALLTGIEELATRGDLLDRSLIAYLPRIPDHARKLEDELDRDFYEARPRILGALLDAVSGALRNYDSTKLDKLPRMADFAKWVSAAEPALGWKPGSFMKAYDANREEAVDLTLEASPVAAAIKKIALPWEGTATDLLKVLDAYADERTRKLKAWPQTGRGLSNALRRLAPALAQTGTEISFERDNGSSDRKRLVKITDAGTDRVGETSSEPSEPSNEGKTQAKSSTSRPEALDAALDANPALDASQNLSSNKKPNKNAGFGRLDELDAKIPTLSAPASAAPRDSNGPDRLDRLDRQQPEHGSLKVVKMNRRDATAVPDGDDDGGIGEEF